MNQLLSEMMNAFLNGWAYHQLIVNKNNDPVDYIFLEVNEAFENLTGLAAKKIIGKKVTEVIPGIEKSKPDLIKVYGEVAQTGVPTQLEIYFEPFDKYYTIYITCPETGFFITTFEDVSAFRKKEKEYQTIIQSTFDGFWVCDLEGRILEVNRAFCEILGYTESELLTMSIPDFEVIEKPEDTAARIRKIIETGSDRFETKHRRKDGRILDVEINASYLSIDGGKLFIFNTDITKEKQAEIVLRESEANYKTLTEASQDHIFNIGKDLRVIFINQRAATTFHSEPEKLIGRHIREIFPPAVAESQINSLNQVLQSGESFSSVAESVFPGGSVWLDTTLSAIKDINGEIISVMGVSRDVTEKKKKENELVLKNIVYNTTIAANSISDLNGMITSANESFLKIWGYDAIEEVVGKPIPDFIKHENEALGILNSLNETGKWQGTYIALKKDGSIFHARASASILQDSNGNTIGYQSSVFDVSEAVEAEKKIVENERRFRSLVMATSSLVWKTDGDGTVKEYQEGWGKFTGQSFLEMKGSGWLNVIHPDDQRKTASVWYDAIIQKSSYEIEHRLRRSDGIYRDFDVKAVPLLDESGNIKEWIGTHTDITEKKEAEKIRIESEENFRMLLNKSPFPMVIADLDSKVEMTNESFKTLIGYSEEDISTVNDWWIHAYPDELYRLEMKNRWMKETEDALKENRNIEPYDAKIRCKDGSDRIFSIIDTKIGDKYLIVYTDLTQRIKAEEERDHFFKVSLDLLCIAGTDGYFKQMNPAWSEVLGWSIEELKAKPFFDFIHPDDISATLKEVEKLETGVTTIRFTNRYQCKNGTYKWLTWNSAPFGDALYSVATDVTDLKNAQNKVDELNNRLTLALEGGNIGVWEWLLASNDLTWNEHMESMFGLAPGTFNGTYDAFKKQVHPDDIGFTEEAIEKALSGEKPYDIVFRSKQENGEIRYINAKAIVVKDSKGNNERMIGVCYDVTEVKIAEQNLQIIADELKRSNQELEQFAYVASHDLQQPLRMVASYTQLLEKKYKDQIDEKANLYIHYAVDGAKRMQIMINDLLAYSRVSTKGEAFTRIDTNKVVENSLTNLEMLIREKDAKISIENLPEIFGDAAQIQSLFQNLVENALKYSGDQKPEIQISAKSKGNKQIFSVKDSGIGIDPKFQEKVFVIFQRLHTREEYSGIGIGLAICKRIVNRHGGEIWFESEKNKGTTFYFSIPNKT